MTVADHDASIEALGPPTGRCQCLCGCHNTSHGRGCRNPTGDLKVLPEYREIACFDCLIGCDGDE